MTLVQAELAATHEQPEHTAVDKAINVLAAFPPGDHAVGVTELAHQLGLPKSTVFRALKVLTRQGLVETVGGRYRLGHRLFELGKQVYQPCILLWEHLSPVVVQLCEQTHQSVALGILRNEDPVVVGMLPGTGFQAHGSFELGAPVPVHCTALGKALVAHSPVAIEAAVSRRLIPMTARTIVDPARLRVELDSVRRTGLAFEDGERAPGSAAVAIALLDAAGHPAAAIAVIGRSGHLDAQATGDVLRQARAGATALLRGYQRRIDSTYGPRTSPSRAWH